MDQDLLHLIELKGHEKNLENFDDLVALTNAIWRAQQTDLQEVERLVDFHTKVGRGIARLAGNVDEISKIRAAVGQLLGEDTLLLAASGPVGAACSKYLETKRQFDVAYGNLATAAHTSVEALSRAFSKGLPQVQRACVALSEKAPLIKNWCTWRKVRAEAMSEGLGGIVVALENGTLSSGESRQAFEVVYSRWWINKVVDQDDVLRQFVSAEHEHAISDFQDLDNKLMQATLAYIRARLSGKSPNFDRITVGTSTEWGTLKREVNKKKRIMPLRQLIASLPNALPALAPCLLMSPLSIAQYLAADSSNFDFVVFDEASQLPVQEAIGAIARGKRLVVVGDPKQLPPTSFFDRSDEDANGDVSLEDDLESILDECLGANLPHFRLNWHYRSRHESLIAFSNHRYYSNGLVTFPSPNTVDSAVNFHLVEGTYDKGGSRTGRAEAEAVVKDIVSRLLQPGMQESGLSIGVVCFNQEQQRLIEDLLDNQRRLYPAIEPYFDDDQMVEPVMVKNLESVQGDERDIMYFSVTYGPDSVGRVSMNFGPLNRDGGHRRLNVAITRARHELRVYSTLRPEQFDLTRTDSLGVADLKHFMEYAQCGPRALNEAVFGSIGDYDSPFEEAVAEALRNQGWQVHPQIGVSSFRIDLGVVHPDEPGRYLAGVECDGATYHHSATARDRDKLREDVLRGLGWHILRVWSTDWWINPAGCAEQIDAALRAHLDVSRKKEQEEEDAQQQQWAEVADELKSTGIVEEEPVEEQPAELFAGYHAEVEQDVVTPDPEPLYEDVDAEAVSGIRADASRFYEPSYLSSIHRLSECIVNAEGPIREDLLIRRIAELHGFSRAGSQIADIVRKTTRDLTKTKDSSGTFIWPKNAVPADWDVFRRPSRKNARAPDQIAIEELRVLAREQIARNRFGEDAIRLMANEVGIRRLTDGIRARLEDALSQEPLLP